MIWRGILFGLFLASLALLLWGCASAPYTMTRLTVTHPSFVQSAPVFQRNGSIEGWGRMEFKIHVPANPDNLNLHIELIGNDDTRNHYVLTARDVNMGQSVWLIPYAVRKGHYHIRIALVTVLGHEFVYRGEVRVL